jgi:hypothetical protein
MKIFDDGIAKFGRTPIAVEILNPQDQSSTVLFSTLLRAPEGDGMAKMKITRRGRRNAAAVGNFRFQISDFRLA